MIATCGTGPYLPSSVFVSNSSFNGAPVAHCLPFVLSLFDLCPSVCWFLMLIGSQIVLVFSTYFIFCSYLYDNQNTSGEKCQNYAQVVKHVNIIHK